MKEKFYDLILGLGEACACTDSLRRNNLQFFSYPLDWLYGSNFVDRIKIVESRFERFLEFDDLIYSHPVLSVRDAYYNTFNDLTFNHDFPQNVPLKVSFPLIKEKYDRRINRLLNLMDKANSILFVNVENPAILRGENLKFGKEEILVPVLNRLKCAFPNSNCELLYLEHLVTSETNKIQYNNYQGKIMKFSYYNRSYDEKAEPYQINDENTDAVLSLFGLTNHFMTIN